MGKLKKIFFYIGRALSFVGLIYVIYILAAEYTLSEYLKQLNEFKYLLPLLIGLNVMSYMLGVYVWYLLLANYSKLKFNYSFAFYHFAKTDIAKYLPGNIFHILGRQLLSKKLKIEQHEMLKITIFFSYLIIQASFLIVTILAFYSEVLSSIHYIFLVVINLFILLITLKTYPSIKIQKKIKMVSSFCVGLLFQSLIIIVIILNLGPNIELNILINVVIVYISSSIIGFITPGASGGIGVREAAFFALLVIFSIDLASDVASFTILFVRFINVIADILANLFTYFQKQKVELSKNLLF